MHGSAKKHRYPLRLPDEYAWLGEKHRYPLRLPDEYAWLGEKTPLSVAFAG